MIIAVDFDGVLVRDEFPDIGKKNEEMVRAIKKLIEQGHEVILWTCRVDTELQNAVEWCKKNGLKFAAINDNAPSNKKKYEKKYPNGTRKVYADYYIDDHSINYELKEAVRLLKIIGGVEND